MKQQPKLEVTYVNLDELTLNPLNSKLHPADQIDQIAASIEQFGDCDPLGVWTNDAGELVIVEGHGRYAALKKLGITEVPIIRLDHLSDEQRRAYGLVHNKLTMNSNFDFELLQNELDMVTNIDMEDFGFTEIDLGDIDDFFGDDIPEAGESNDNPTSNKIVCPECGHEFEL